MIGTALAGTGDALALAAGAVGLLMLTLWIASVVLGDASIVDPAWGPAFVLVAGAGVVEGGGNEARRWLLLSLTAAWGLRLGLHLLVRRRSEPGEDRRYARMRARHGENFAAWSAWAIFGAQGLLVLIVSLPLTVAAERPDALNALIAPGLVLFAIGLGFETLGDEQLRRFKADPANRGRVMDRGLWRYTRHPNYFGDTCVWWGLWLVCMQADAGVWWTAVGPATMTWLLVRVSGKKLLEHDIAKRRPEYADYVRETSGFVPRPPRR